VKAVAAGARQDRGPVRAGKAVLHPTVGTGTVPMDEVDGGGCSPGLGQVRRIQKVPASGRGISVSVRP
jgi:hypothetical protein